MLGLPLPPLLYFHSFILSSFVFIMLGNALLPNCFLFTTLMVSPCLWTMGCQNVLLLTAVLWPWKGRKNVFGANAVWISSAKDAGATYAAFIWRALRQPWTFCRGPCFPDIVSNAHHFTAGLNPSQTATLSELMASLPRQCVSSSVLWDGDSVRVSACEVLHLSAGVQQLAKSWLWGIPHGRMKKFAFN